jgi:hypothetical protein
VRARLELPSYSTVDTIAARVRPEVNAGLHTLLCGQIEVQAREEQWHQRYRGPGIMIYWHVGCSPAAHEDLRSRHRHRRAGRASLVNRSPYRELPG